MTITHRSFLHEQDKQLMIDLACQFQTDHLHVVDLPYWLSSWGLDDKENIRLWFDGRISSLGLPCKVRFGRLIMLAMRTIPPCSRKSLHGRMDVLELLSVRHTSVRLGLSMCSRGKSLAKRIWKRWALPVNLMWARIRGQRYS